MPLKIQQLHEKLEFKLAKYFLVSSKERESYDIISIVKLVIDNYAISCFWKFLMFCAKTEENTLTFRKHIVSFLV